MVGVRTCWESVTTVDGQTVEGGYGLVTPDGDHLDMTDAYGSKAAALLEANTVDMRASAAVEHVRDTLGVLDHLEVRWFEVIAYAADLPDVGDDVPYVRSIVIVTNDERLSDAVAARLEEQR